MQDELTPPFHEASLELLRIIAGNQQALAQELAEIKAGLKYTLEQTVHARVLAGHALDQIAEVAQYILPAPEVDPDEALVDSKIEELLAGGLPNDPAIIEATRARLLEERKQAVIDATWQLEEEPAVEDQAVAGNLARLQELLDESQQS